MGYVEDEESIDAIMKKFEELENMKKEISKPKVEDVEELDSVLVADPQLV